MGMWSAEYLSRRAFINTDSKSCIMRHDKQCKLPIRELHCKGRKFFLLQTGSVYSAFELGFVRTVNVYR